MPIVTLTFIVIVVYVGLFALYRRFYERDFFRTVMCICGTQTWVVNNRSGRDKASTNYHYDAPASYLYVQRPVFKSAATFSVWVPYGYDHVKRTSSNQVRPQHRIIRRGLNIVGEVFLPPPHTHMHKRNEKLGLASGGPRLAPPSIRSQKSPENRRCGHAKVLSFASERTKTARIVEPYTLDELKTFMIRTMRSTHGYPAMLLADVPGVNSTKFGDTDEKTQEKYRF